MQELTKVYYYIDLLCWTPSPVLSNSWNYTQEHYKRGTFYGIEVERHIPLDSMPVRIHVNPSAQLNALGVATPDRCVCVMSVADFYGLNLLLLCRVSVKFPHGFGLTVHFCVVAFYSSASLTSHSVLCI